MVTREEALKFLNEKVLPRGQLVSGQKEKNIIKHMLATEAIMGGVYDFLKTRGESNLGGMKEEWIMAGLLHDGDYCDEVPKDKQGIQVTEWLRERGYEIPKNVAYTMAAHNWQATGIEPKTKMDWAIFCGDSLTGLIVAAALVRPDKKLASVKTKSVMKKFKDKAFARGTRRKDIALCEKKLGISLRDFVEIGLNAMQKIHKELGL